MLTAVKSKAGALGSMAVEVETKTDAFAFSIRPGETLLAAGLSAGFSLPYECATGTCGTCHARVMTGEVDPGWREAPAYRKLRIEKGDVLMCQAHARGDCSLRVKTGVAQPSPNVAKDLERKGVVEAVRRLTHDVIHFDVALTAPIDFDAGQFVTVGHPEVVGRRAYSMVNFGRAAERLSFLVKRKPEGRFSDLVFDRELMDAELDILGPLGRATFRPDEGHDIICVAGGSGIAGMMSILQHATIERYFESHRGQVFFGVRTLADAFYLEDFSAHLVAANGGLDVTIAISEGTDGPVAHPQFPHVLLAVGMVHDVAARSIVAGSCANTIGLRGRPTTDGRCYNPGLDRAGRTTAGSYPVRQIFIMRLV